MNPTQRLRQFVNHLEVIASHLDAIESIGAPFPVGVYDAEGPVEATVVVQSARIESQADQSFFPLRGRRRSCGEQSSARSYQTPGTCCWRPPACAHGERMVLSARKRRGDRSRPPARPHGERMVLSARKRRGDRSRRVRRVGTSAV